MSGALDVLDEMEPGPEVPFREPRPYLDEAPAQEAPTSHRYNLLTVAELHELPRLEWLIHSVLPATGCAVIYGASGSGKTFIQISMLAALGDGDDWFGHKVREPARVVVVVLEGEAGFRNRIEAWEVHHGRDFPSTVKFVFQPFRLNDRTDVLALAAAIEAGGGADVLVVDTLNRAMPGADENSSKDMGLTLERGKELQSMFGGLLLMIHHSGKDHSKGMRGHSSLHAAMDAALEVVRQDGRREWTVAKSKDDVDGKTHAFRLEVVTLGEDDQGEPITSCVVRSDVDAEPAAQRPRLPKGGNQRIIYDALGPLFTASTAFGKAGAPPTRPCLRLDDAIAGTKDHLAVEPKRRPERTRLAITGLIATHVLACNEDWIWLR